MATQLKPTQCITPPFRISFPAIFEKKMNNLSKKMEYSCVALWPPGADMSGIKAAIFEAGKSAWGPDPAKWPKPASGLKMRSPLRDQGEKEKVDENTGEKFLPPGHVKGAMFANMKAAKDKPGIIDQKKRPITEPDDIYAGCWVRASINAYAYSQGGNVGIALGLNGIQKVKDDEPFSGRGRVEDQMSELDMPAGEDPVSSGGSASVDSLFS